MSILITYSNLCKFGGFVSGGCQILGHQKVVLYLKQMYLLPFLLGVCVQQGTNGQSSEPAQLATVTRLQVTCQACWQQAKSCPSMALSDLILPLLQIQHAIPVASESPCCKEIRAEEKSGSSHICNSRF